MEKICKTWLRAFAVYLTLYQILMLPYMKELYSNSGIVLHPRWNWSSKYFPNILLQGNTAQLIQILSIIGILSSLLLFLPTLQKISAAVLFFLHWYFFNLNNFTLAPQYPYIGWLLLALVFLPIKLKNKEQIINFQMIQFSARLILSLTYLSIFFDRIFLPEWQSGFALKVIFTDFPVSTLLGKTIFNFLSQKALFIFNWLTLLTYFLGAIGMLQPKRKGQLIGWLSITLLHISSLILLKLTQVSLGMLLFHLFCFNPFWLKETFFKEESFNWRQTHKKSIVSLVSVFLFLTCIGLLQMTAYWLHFHEVKRFAFMTAASPLPQPFGEGQKLNMLEYDSVFKISFSTPSGSHEININNQFLSHIHGPHQRVIAHTSFLQWPFLMPNEWIKHYLNWSYCQANYISFLQIEEPIEQVQFYIRDKNYERLYKESCK